MTATGRSAALRTVVDAAEAAFTARATDPRSQASVARSFAALATVRDATTRPGARLPVCDRWLAVAAELCRGEPGLRRLVDTILAVEPAIRWQRRGGPAPAASDGFAEGHANGMLFGPGGLEPRSDVWLGVSLLAPGTRYPDHTHPPEETYLVLGPGEFSQEDGPWFAPGLGGSFYNPPGIRHAMRAGAEPLLAVWLLRSGEA